MRIYPGATAAAALAALLIAGPAFAEGEDDDKGKAAEASGGELGGGVMADGAMADDGGAHDPIPLETYGDVEESDGFRFYLEAEDEGAETKAHSDYPSESKISVNLWGGTNFTGIGDFVEAQTATGGGFTVIIPERDFGDVYGFPLTFGLDINHRIRPQQEVFASFHYTYADSEEFTFVTASPPLGGLSHLRGEFSDYHQFGLDLGVRHFFDLPGGFSPYVGVRGGMRIVGDIDLDLETPGGSTAGIPQDIDFFDTTITYGVGFDVGVEYSVRPNVSLGVETGVHYMGDLNSDESLRGFDRCQ
jgi:opacity protein-like surface antigen